MDICFKNIFEEFYYPLFLYAYQIIKDANVSEDLVQDVFHDTWLKRGEIDFSRSIRPYLYKATYYKCIDYLRHQQMKEDKLNMAGEDTFFNLYIKNNIPNQEEELEIKEIIKEIAVCKEKLTSQCRKVFELSREQQFKNKEIADQLGISIKAVEKHLAKALNLIREHLSNKKLIS